MPTQSESKINNCNIESLQPLSDEQLEWHLTMLAHLVKKSGMMCISEEGSVYQQK